MKKFIKWFLIIITIFVLAILIGLGFYISSTYLKAKSLQIDQDILTSPSLSVKIFNIENQPIKDSNEINREYAKITSLQENTKNAFISIEDKNFYNHHGVNYKRILKAMINNIKSGKLKEGASTITQQLIKNTQLTSEKTFERKIKEIALAQKIEKMYTKDEILEMYLNVIYFGNNCYGIESASKYYFSKPASELTIDESAVLAGIIKSPAKYSPIKNQENCLKRRNLVLKEMLNDNHISFEQYNSFINSKLNLNLNTEKNNKLNSYSQSALDEAEKILGIPARQIALNGYKIYTYQDKKKQQFLEEAINEQNVDCDSAGIIIDNVKHGVSAYIGDSIYKILDAKRQPGSCIKPILVYGPALNEDLIYPCTQILDEKTTISDYTPKNVGNIYHGYVSARESLAKSINIPAVKILSYVGIEKAKKYGEYMGITFDENDDSYTLALGGMTYGVNILQLSGAYSTFANNGLYSQPQFISFITDNNDKLIYYHKPQEKRVLREDSTYLLNDMLKSCVEYGTAKKLSDLNIEIASKTGTVGKPNSNENLDAWNISYTKNQTCGIWLGNLDNKPITYAGGNQPTMIVKNYFKKVSDDSTFYKPSCITEKYIDTLELEENHRIFLTNNLIPERYIQKEIFSSFNLPKDISEHFSKIEKTLLQNKVENNKAIIKFDAKNYLTYNIYVDNKLYKSITNKSGEQTISIPLTSTKKDVSFESFYTLQPDLSNIQKISFVNTQKYTEDKKWFI